THVDPHARSVLQRSADALAIIAPPAWTDPWRNNDFPRIVDWCSRRIGRRGASCSVYYSRNLLTPQLVLGATIGGVYGPILRQRACARIAESRATSTSVESGGYRPTHASSNAKF